MATTVTRAPRGRREGLAVLLVLVAILAVVLARGDRMPWSAAEAEPKPVVATGNEVNPFVARSQLVRSQPRLVAASLQATGDGDTRASEVLDRLATVPTGVWILPEQHGTPTDVAGFVTDVVAKAAAADRLALFVVYGITDRDCTDGFSSGGLPVAAYGPWISAIADAATGANTAVVLEPDALVSATQCNLEETRVGQLRAAVETFRAAGVPTYVDAGHSAWLPPDEAAALLRQVDVDSVRGFAVNVANYQPLATVTDWAEQVSDLVGGAHFVVDTGRNGAARRPIEDWCNPGGQALGREPGFVDDGTRLDALLWVKPPWESDGTCRGGPDAGQLWTDRAKALAYAAGW